MHKKHLLPTFADKSQEEEAIESLTETITKVLVFRNHLKVKTP
jgi:hypothetical protein